MQNKSKSDRVELFNQVYNDYYERACVFAQSYLHDAENARDIVAESMLNYWERIEHIDSSQNPIAFLFTIVKNKCIDSLRTQRAALASQKNIMQEELDELDFRNATLEACNLEKLFAKEMQSIINKTLAKLPENTRQVFILARIKQIPYKEIAFKLNISVKGVDYHMAQAMKAFRLSLGDYMYVALLLLAVTM